MSALQRLAGWIADLRLAIGLLIVIAIIEIIFTIIAMVKASEGEVYRYPLSIRFISFKQ